jgi:hypothetical protein
MFKVKRKYLQSENHELYLFRDALIEAERALSGDRDSHVVNKEIPTKERTAPANMVAFTSQR